MKRRSILAMLIGSAAWCSGVSDFDEQVLAFNHLWGVFFRKHFGCKPDETVAAQCKPPMGTVALKDFEKAGKLANKLWPE